MDQDLSNLQVRWHSLREEKATTASTLGNIKRAEEELDRLAEEKSRIELDEKVINYSEIFWNAFTWQFKFLLVCNNYYTNSSCIGSELLTHYINKYICNKFEMIG